jgi:hypothetical protein
MKTEAIDLGSSCCNIKGSEQIPVAHPGSIVYMKMKNTHILLKTFTITNQLG